MIECPSAMEMWDGIRNGSLASKPEQFLPAACGYSTGLFMGIQVQDICRELKNEWVTQWEKHLLGY